MDWICVFFLALATVVYGAEIIFERCEVYDVNPKFLDNVTLSVKRTSRRSPYYVHASGRLLQTIGDNVTINVVFYEFLHNEYKPSFVEITLKLCDVLRKEPWRSVLGVVLTAHGAECPAPPKMYNLANITLAMNKFPGVMPFERFMSKSHVRFTPTEETIVKSHFYMRYVRDLPKGK